MTQAISAPSLRPAESRFIAVDLRRAYGQPLLHAAAGAIVRVRARRLQCELYRTRVGTDGIQRRRRRAADADRIPGRSDRRARRADRGPCHQQRRLRGCGHRRFILGVHSDVWPRRRRQHRISPGRLFAALAPHAGRAARPDIFVSFVFRHRRFGHRTGDAALHAKRIRLARRLSRRGDLRLHRPCRADCAARAGRRRNACRQIGRQGARGRGRYRLARADDAARSCSTLRSSCCSRS